MIDNLLDKDGRGVLTPELDRIFTVGGCRPMCHVCHKDLKVNKTFRLKPFAVERSESEIKKSLDIMTCEFCDKENKKLPYHELHKALKSLGIDTPAEVSTDMPINLDQKREWRRRNPNADYRELRKQEWSMFDDNYIDASLKYETAIKKLHKKYEQLFENESYDERAATERRIERRYLNKRSALGGGGCFVLTEGTIKTIIAGAA